MFIFKTYSKWKWNGSFEDTGWENVSTSKVQEILEEAIQAKLGWNKIEAEKYRKAESTSRKT